MFTLLLNWLLSFGTVASPAPGFPDAPVITEASVGKARIGMPTVELRRLYKGCTFVRVYVARYGWYGEGDEPKGIQVSQGTQPLFVYFEDWEKPGRISGLTALHPTYRTRKNIGVGSTSGALRVAFPSIKVGLDPMDDYGQNLQMASLDGSAITYTFARQKNIGRYTDEVFESPIIVTTAKISWITVFPKNGQKN
ncbi:hypothetical protein [Hymenobacter weizhouensis]|uniref:hypothetical protein n=1 Tax=Hymenobacter sp. YIM 151500-1 TaxID=2987689 RepID=UPI002225E945|nr:hypothetical protein [Hymenobacter sp. YIM 151500-1]UYZ63249.1 hypothetical protein OIS53_00030 [Hymenobacter sp. YIM 151500-1]